MPRYAITHITEYRYDELVPVCHNLAHLLPRNSPRHWWLRRSLEISPQPTVRAQRLDYFGNPLTFFAIQEPHRALAVTSAGEVDIRPLHDETSAGLYPEGPSIAWELARDLIHRHDPLGGGLDVYQYMIASPLASPTADVAAYAAQSFKPGRPLLEAAQDLSARIYRDFEYDPEVTTITSTLDEVMKCRGGVCQDFAHLMVAGLRSLGLAARYVSGYLMTTPPPGKPRLVGADASHAWVSVFIPDAHGGKGAEGTWVDFDPTNNVSPSAHHITIAWGRDFGDVSPLRGVLLSTGPHEIRVSVDVIPLDPA